MATKELKTRIKLKYDTLSNWSTANPVLLSGEVAVVEVPSGGTNPSGIVKTPPSILLKVGDGTTAFNSLPYTTSLAGDVYNWAKGQTAPTNTFYRLVKKNANDSEVYVVALNKDLVNAGNPDDYTHTPTWNSSTNKWMDGTTEWTQIGSAVSAGLTYTFAEGSTNGAFTVTPSGGSTQTVNIHGLNNAAYEGVASTISQSDTGLARASQVYTYVTDAISSIDSMSIVIAWKGDATPVVANIPQGVVVRYNSTDYTGTLAASSSTMKKMYLVYDNNGTKDVYDEYITVRSGTSPSYTYTWEKIGDTGIDLSDYVTQTDLTNTINGLDGNANATGVNSDGTADILTEVAEVDGVVQDVTLEDTSWTFPSTLNIPANSVYTGTQYGQTPTVTQKVFAVKFYSTDFSGSAALYSSIVLTVVSGQQYVKVSYSFSADGSNPIEVYNPASGWVDAGAQTIAIENSGTDITSGDLFTLLDTYATGGASNSSVSKKIRVQKIAVTGNVNDVIQYSGDYLILDCGTATTVI